MMRYVGFLNASVALLFCYACVSIDAKPLSDVPDKCGCIEGDQDEVVRYIYIPPQVARVFKAITSPEDVCSEVATVLSYLKNGVQLCPREDVVPALERVIACACEKDKVVLQRFICDLKKYDVPASDTVKAPGVVRLLNCQTAASCLDATPPNFDADIAILQDIDSTLCSGTDAICDQLAGLQIFCGQLGGQLLSECSGIANSLPDDGIFICDIKTDSIEADLASIPRLTSNTACFDVAAAGTLGAGTACIGILSAAISRTTTACIDTAIADRLVADTACIDDLVTNRIASDTACIQNADVCQLLLQDLFLENILQFSGTASGICGFPQGFGEVFLPWSAWSEPFEVTPPPPSLPTPQVVASERDVVSDEPVRAVDFDGADTRAVTRSTCAPTGCYLQVARERVVCPYNIGLAEYSLVKGAKLFRSDERSGTFVDLLVPADYDGRFELEVAFILDKDEVLNDGSSFEMIVAFAEPGECFAVPLPQVSFNTSVDCPEGNNIGPSNDLQVLTLRFQLDEGDQSQIQPGNWLRLVLAYDDSNENNVPCLLVNSAIFRYTRKNIDEAFAIFPGA